MMWSAEPLREVIYSDEVTADWFHEECVRVSKPVVIRGLAAHWRSRKWRFPNLRNDWPLPAVPAHAFIGGRGQTLEKEILTLHPKPVARIARS